MSNRRLAALVLFKVVYFYIITLHPILFAFAIRSKSIFHKELAMSFVIKYYKFLHFLSSSKNQLKIRVVLLQSIIVQNIAFVHPIPNTSINYFIRKCYFSKLFPETPDISKHSNPTEEINK